MTGSAQAASFYVQANRITVRSQPKATGEALAELVRGDRVESSTVNGFWTRVEMSDKSPKVIGWVTRLALGEKPPVGQSTLVDAGKLSDERASRERQKSPTLAASSRGLSQSQVGARMRGAQIKYKPDEQAVKRMDGFGVSEKDLDKFLTAAKLER